MIEGIVLRIKHVRLISLFDAQIYLVMLQLKSVKQKTLAAQEAFSNVLTQAARKMLNCVVRAQEKEAVHALDRLVFSAMMVTAH